MTQYSQKTFSVPTASRDPSVCGHKWQRVNPRTRKQECVQCGQQILEPEEPT